MSIDLPAFDSVGGIAETGGQWTVASHPIPHPTEDLVVVVFTRHSTRARWNSKPRFAQLNETETYLLTATEHSRMVLEAKLDGQRDFARLYGRAAGADCQLVEDGAIDAPVAIASFSATTETADAKAERIKAQHLAALENRLAMAEELDQSLQQDHHLSLMGEVDFPETNADLQTAMEAQTHRLIERNFTKNGEVDGEAIYDQMMRQDMEDGGLPANTGLPLLTTETSIDLGTLAPVRSRVQKVYTQLPIFDGAGAFEGTSLALQKDTSVVLTPKKFAQLDSFMRVHSGFSREFFKKQVTKERAFGLTFALGALMGVGNKDTISAGSQVFQNGKARTEKKAEEPSETKAGADGNKADEKPTRAVAAPVPPMSFGLNFMSKKSKLIERATLAVLSESRIDRVVKTEIDL
ncbi:MAG: hypothetical protein AAGF33_14600 [Pseudomonadota bacterium]